MDRRPLTSTIIFSVSILLFAGPLDPLHATARSSPFSGGQDPREALEREIQGGKATLQTYLALADMNREKGQVDGAIQVLTEAASRFRSAPEPCFRLGTLLLRKGDFNSALENFQKAVELSGSQARYVESLAAAHYEKGMWAFRNGSYFESLSDARAALRLSPGHPEFQHLLGLSSFLLGQKTDARSALEKAVELSPENGSFRYDLAILLLEMGDLKSAEDQLVRAIELDPELAMAYVYLGRLQHNDKRVAEALASFQKARDLDPRLRGVHYHIGYSHKALGDDRGAIEEMTRELENYPDFVPALTELGDLYLRIGEPERAVAPLEEAGRLDRETARIPYLLGKALADLERNEQALASLRESVRMAPDHPEPHYLMGQIYLKMGKTDLAEQQLALFREKRKKTGSPW